MKITNITLTAMALLTPFLFAEEKGHQGQDHGAAGHVDKIAGPNEGRILTSTEPHAEFFVTPERMVKITFIDEKGKAVASEGATVSAIGGDRSAPTRLAFTRDGEGFISDKALPEGKSIPIILQFKATADAASVTERFSVDFNECPTCKHLEYNCTCEHGGEHEGHDH